MCIRDRYDNGELVGEYRAKEIMDRFGWKHYQQVAHYSEAGILYQGRYRIERLEPLMKPEQIQWAEEWDKARQRILAVSYTHLDVYKRQL